MFACLMAAIAISACVALGVQMDIISIVSSRRIPLSESCVEYSGTYSEQIESIVFDIKPTMKGLLRLRNDMLSVAFADLSDPMSPKVIYYFLPFSHITHYHYFSRNDAVI